MVHSSQRLRQQQATHLATFKRGSWLLLPFISACLQFLTTLTFRALHCNHIVSIPFETIVEKKTKKTERDVEDYVLKWADDAWVYLPSTRNMLFFHSLFSFPWFLRFSLFFVQPGNPNTIQYQIPGWTTIVKLLEQVKNWQSPSRDPWSNCLINSQDMTKVKHIIIPAGKMTIQRQFKNNLRTPRVSARLSKNHTRILLPLTFFFLDALPPRVFLRLRGGVGFGARSLLSCPKLHWSPFEHWPFFFRLVTSIFSYFNATHSLTIFWPLLLIQFSRVWRQSFEIAISVFLLLFSIVFNFWQLGIDIFWWISMSYNSNTHVFSICADFARFHRMGFLT